MNDRMFQVSVNYYNMARNGYLTSFIESQTHDFKVGETILFEETTHEGLQLTGRTLMVVIVNVGTNIRGLRRGFCIVSFKLFG